MATSRSRGLLPDSLWRVGQMSGRPSDAYATGEACDAQRSCRHAVLSPCVPERCALSPRHTHSDGTWFADGRIPTEAPVSRPYLEPGRRTVHHHFTSAMATSGTGQGRWD